MTADRVCETHLDICLIIDSSGSIRDSNPLYGTDNWQLQLEFLATLIEAFRVDTRVGAIVFSTDARLEFSLNTYTTKDEIQNAIRNLNYMGGLTNTPEALIQTRLQCFSPTTGDRPGVANLAIIVTDGVPNLDMDSATREAAALRDTGVTMIAIGVTARIDEGFLKEMSSPPQIKDQNYFMAADFSALSKIATKVVAGTCGMLQSSQFVSL